MKLTIEFDDEKTFDIALADLVALKNMIFSGARCIEKLVEHGLLDGEIFKPQERFVEFKKVVLNVTYQFCENPKGLLPPNYIVYRLYIDDTLIEKIRCNNNYDGSPADVTCIGKYVKLIEKTLETVGIEVELKLTDAFSGVIE